MLFLNLNVSKESRGRRLVFELKDADLSIVNALRRVILMDIENVAIAWNAYESEENGIRILKNTSALHNEFVGHRISLVPVCVTEDELTKWSKFNKYKFVINTDNKGKGEKEKNQSKWVTTRDIRVIHSDTNEPYHDGEAIRSSLFPPDPITKDYIILTKLKHGEEFHVEFQARIGTAKDHARWCPVSTCTYEMKQDTALVDRERKLFIENHSDDPKDLNRFDSIDRQKLVVRNKKGEPSHFKFTVESECRLSPTFLVDSAFEVILNKLDHLKTGSMLTAKLLHEEKEKYMYSIDVQDEDHTMGNLIYQIAMNHFIEGDEDEGKGKEKKTKPIDFIGYYQPHPLKPVIVFKIRFLKSGMDPISFFKHVLDVVKADMEEAKKAWQKALKGLKV